MMAHLVEDLRLVALAGVGWFIGIGLRVVVQQLLRGPQ